MLKPISCNGCVLENHSNGFSVPNGDGSSGVVLVGDHISYGEYTNELVMHQHTQSGSKIEEVFREVQRDTGMPCSKNQFRMMNVIQCNPVGELKVLGSGFEQGAVGQCEQHLEKNLINARPKVIMALGPLALKTLTGFTGIGKEKQDEKYLRGFVFPHKHGLVIPSYHPLFLRKGNNHLTPVLVEDVKRALLLARGMYSNYPTHIGYTPPNYNVSPGLDEAWAFYRMVKDNPRLVLTFDIETTETIGADEDEREDLVNTEITLVQFSVRKGSGIAFPYRGDYLPIISAVFKLPNVKANHNTWNFDNPRLRAKGIEIAGRIHDTMWMFKHWHPKLPRGLQSVVSMFGFPFPWKHLYSTQLEWYGCADVDAVQWIIHALPPLMKVMGVWEGYKRHVADVYTIMDRASVHGIPVDETKRLEVETSFKAKRLVLDKDIQAIVPMELRNVKPKRKVGSEWDYGYKKIPKVVQEERYRYQQLATKLSDQGKKFVDFDTFIYRKHNLAECTFVDSENPENTITRWAVVEPFKASKDQLVRYLNWKREGLEEEARAIKEIRNTQHGGRNPELTGKANFLLDQAYGYKIPQNFKTKKDTTSKKELEEMFIATGDPILEKVVAMRSLDTNLNNFLPNWKPSKDGRVHPVYGYTPPQGQINSWQPNSQNVSKHTEFGNEFRGIIQASKGYVFIEADKKSFHVGTAGYCANDVNHIRFSQIDPHSIAGSYIDPTVIGESISFKWSDEEIKIACKEFKKRCKEHKAKDPTRNMDVRQELAKPTVLGDALELGIKKLQRQNRRFIQYVTEKERIYYKGSGYSAEKLQNVLHGILGPFQRYKEAIKEKAFIEKRLVNEFGRIQYFYDVFVFVFNGKIGKWDRKEGTGARQPIAFRVQSPAFGMITEELLELERLGVCEEHNFLVTIHDSLFFMPEESKKDKCIEIVNEVMNRPCKQLVNTATGTGGLKIGVEIAIGKNWKSYHKDKNPEGMKEI